MKYPGFLLLFVLLTLSAFGEDPEMDRFYLQKIPYDSIQARIDIDKGIIRIVDLISPTYEAERTRIQDIISPENLKYIEETIGFEFVDIFIDSMAPKYLTTREEEYNAIVYQYLSDKHNQPARLLIKNSILTIYHDQKNQLAKN